MFFSCTVVSTVTFFKLPGFMVLLFSPALMVSISNFSLLIYPAGYAIWSWSQGVWAFYAESILHHRNTASTDFLSSLLLPVHLINHEGVSGNAILQSIKCVWQEHL